MVTKHRHKASKATTFQLKLFARHKTENRHISTIDGIQWVFNGLIVTAIQQKNCVKHAKKWNLFSPLRQVRIQDLVKGGPQLLRLKVVDVVKRSCASEASILRPGSRARLRALEAFGFLMLKYAFSHILETLFLLFKTSILTPKVDKNRALDFTSINLKHSHMLHLFF